MRIPEEIDLRDFSDKRECYRPCPKCGSDKLAFMTILDLLVYLTSHRMEYTSSIACENCGFRLATREEEARKKKIATAELNRRNWNALYEKNKQNQRI